jgi:hypothetical protein
LLTGLETTKEKTVCTGNILADGVEHVAPAPGGSSGAVATRPKVRPLNSKMANKKGEWPKNIGRDLRQNLHVHKMDPKRGLT